MRICVLSRRRETTNALEKFQNECNAESSSFACCLEICPNISTADSGARTSTPLPINHPIAVAEVLARVAGVTDLAMLQAAILHDTIEDTQTTAQELDEQFGQEVRLLVEELTDDKSLPRACHAL